MLGNNYISITAKGIEASLEVYFCKSDGCEIAYSPALDVLGYGKTVKEAMASFEVVVADFFTSCMKRGTLDEYLTGKKWTRKPKQAVFVSPQISSLVSNNRFQRVLDSPRLSKRTIKQSLSYC